MRISNEQIKKLYNEGKTLGEIGLLANISRERVRQIINNNAHKKLYKRILRKGIKIFEHRYVIEQYLGRKLLPGEEVHHKNGNTLDNRLSNLEIITDRKIHFQKHLALYKKKNSMNYIVKSI